MNDTVDIVCSVLDREQFLPDLFDSLDRQTHKNWRLWMRDDGSRDGSVALMRARAAADERITILHVGGPRLGAAAAYGWLLDRAPADARYLMTADADDVWLPAKIERTLAALQSAERALGDDAPIVAHSDMVVVDERLDVIHPSYWEFTDLAPEPATLRRHMVRTLTAGPTLMMNAPLRALIGTIPANPRGPDSWIGLVAIVRGHVVVVREPTVLYRQHAANDSAGARDPRLDLRRLAPAVARGIRNSGKLREWLGHAAAQARDILDRHGAQLAPDDRRLLSAFARLPGESFLARKLDLARYRVLREEGVIRSIGVLLRG
jgi:glycosyltransferase involved in cell wall biosynthesis